MNVTSLSRLIGSLALLLFLVIGGFADVQVRCGQASAQTRRCTVSIEDPTGQEIFWTSVTCQNCHKAPLPGGQDLRKSYDAKSQAKHVQEYAFTYNPNDIDRASRFPVLEGQRILWEKGVYLTRDNGRIVVINEIGKYKLLCDNDTVVVKDRYGKPGIVISNNAIQRIDRLEPRDLALPVRK